MLGTLNFHWSMPRLAPPTSSPPSKMVCVEVLRVAYAEESAPGGTIAGEDAGAPVLMGVAGTNVSPRTDGNRMNRVEPRPKDAPGQATLTPRTLKGSGFSPSSEAALYDVMSVPGSFGIVDLGTREPGLLTYTRAPLLPAS
jgi:hypothetical protein